MEKLEFAIVRSEVELHHIHDLNYQTFVEEIPQHKPNRNRSLTDRFEKESTYIVCRKKNELLGMMAVRCNRPFSLDGKLADLDSYLPQHKSVCEVRLLSVKPEKRGGYVLSGLFRTMCQFCLVRGHDLAVISGTLRQIKLYKHMGFTPFGPIVGSKKASYQPMWLHVKNLQKQSVKLESELLASAIRKNINLLPGPVNLASSVEAALGGPSISHRGDLFRNIFEDTCSILCRITGADQVSIAGGGGTLANDLVAGQLLQLGGHGLILVNGEFGKRLTDHAERFGLSFDDLTIPWGDSYDRSDIDKKLKSRQYSWIWSTHAETSSGVLNDIEMLKSMSVKYDLHLCLDCVSSLGVVPCDLRGVSFASTSSGKGLKALAGLAIVLHNKTLPVQTKPLPRSLDLGLYASNGIPFTLPSRLLTALHVSLESLLADPEYSNIKKSAIWLRKELVKYGIKVLPKNEKNFFPGVISIILPSTSCSMQIGDRLEFMGWSLNFRSTYLCKKNCIQISLLSQIPQEKIESLPKLMSKLVKEKSQ